MNIQSMPQLAAKMLKSRIANALVAALLVSTCGTTFAQDYSLSTAPIGFTSISGNVTGGTMAATDHSALFTSSSGAATTDTGKLDIAVPFDFEFFGQTVTAGTDMLRLFTDGFAGINSTEESSFSPVALTSSSADNNTIFLFWSDLLVPVNSVFSETVGSTVGSRQWVIEYSMVDNFNSGTAVFDGQIVIFEGTNVIELRYSASTNFDSETTTIGLKNADGSITRGVPGTGTQSTAPTSNLVYTPTVITTDLSISGLTLSAGTVAPGDMVTVDFSVDNNSGVDSGMFDVGIYLSTDATIDSGDQLITTIAGLDLVAMTSSAQSETVTVPTPNPVGMNGRQYFIGVLADNAAALVENDTANNSAGAVALIGDPVYFVTTEAQTSFSSIIGVAGTTEIASSAVNPSDDGEVAITSPFEFELFGVTIPMGTDVAVGYNGYIEIGDSNPATGSNFTNTSLPTSNTSTASPNDNVIALFWDDLDVDSSGTATIAQLVTGTTGSQVWTIEFNQLSRSGSTTPGYTGQIVIEEATNTIFLRYDPNLDFSGTANATIGIEGLTGEFIELSAQTGSPLANARPATNFVFLENGNTNNPVDVIPSAVVVAQTMANAAGSIDLALTIDNAGSGASGQFEYTVFLSTDADIDSSDTALGTIVVTDIAATGSSMEMQSVSIPTTTAPGMYFVGVVLNTGSPIVLESNYANNSAAIMTAIQVDAPGKDQGDLDDDDQINVADVMFDINLALNDDTNLAGDLNNDAVVNVLDVQIVINRVLNAP